MNQLELQTKRNNVARLFRHSSKIHRNCIRLNVANSEEHEMAKARICWDLLKQGKEFLVEAELENPFKKRCDIVDLDGTIIEIVKSETEDSIEEKRKSYPLPIVVVKI